VAKWRELKSDPGAQFDKAITLDASELQPMITWSTNPGSGISITAPVPAPRGPADEKGLAYMGLRAGEQMIGHDVDVIFIGSCTNSRLEDLRAAASILRGRKVSPATRVLVVPGSMRVKKEAEAEGLGEVFRAAGAEWRGDSVASGKTALSTSNRNFEGRQGKGARTFLVSPLTAAAAALRGKIADPREVMP
jgi:3-isopropylmalate/(R)-2-methylmalate dehydratase large subunit